MLDQVRGLVVMQMSPWAAASWGHHRRSFRRLIVRRFTVLCAGIGTAGLLGSAGINGIASGAAVVVSHGAPGGPIVAPAASAESCAPIETYPSPPAGFDPLTASNTHLQTFGFPPRPPGSDPGALATWSTAVESAKSGSVPDPVCSTTVHS